MSNNILKLNKKTFYGFISAVFIAYLAISIQYTNKQFMENKGHESEKWVTYISIFLYIIANIILWVVFVYTQKQLYNNNFYFWIITLLCGIQIVNGMIAHYIRSSNLDKESKFKNIIKVNYFLYIFLSGCIFFTILYFKPTASKWLVIIGYTLICINFVFIEPYQRKKIIVDGPTYFITIMAWFLIALGISKN